MKRTLKILITSMFIIGCGIPDATKIETPQPLKVINMKYIGNGVCSIEVTSNNISSMYFKDSCNKYSVGDTITFKK